MNWIHKAEQVFSIKKPLHFTNYQHCDECAENDALLQNLSRDDITLKDIGFPNWDLLDYCNVQAKLYFMSAIVRLSLETIHTDFYFKQFLFHLNEQSYGLSLLDVCTDHQKQFVSSFIEHMIESFPHEIENNLCATETFSSYEMWSNFGTNRTSNHLVSL